MQIQLIERTDRVGRFARQISRPPRAEGSVMAKRPDPVGPPPRIGLVLGAGAAWGAAHVGVLEVLESADVPIAVIVGSSSGAIIGAGYAAGVTAQGLAEWLRSVQWSSFADWRPSRRWALFDSRPIDRIIATSGRPVSIEDLSIPFAAFAFDLRKREPVILRSGPLASALRATVAVPGVLPAVRVDGRILVDGGLADQDAVRAAFELGAERVIVVRFENEPGPDASALTRFLDSATGAKGARARERLAGRVKPDLTIQPVTQGMSRWSARDVARLIDAGRSAADATFPQILALTESSPLP